MPNLNDRGIAAIRQEADGRATVTVCGRVEAGEPLDVFAVHVRAPSVVIRPGVRLLRSGGISYTDAVVDVVREGRAIHVRPVAARRDTAS